MSKALPITSTTREVIDRLAERLRRQAHTHLAMYPQYDGHWDTWRVVEVTADVRTKLGVAFRDGDLVLCSPEVSSERMPPEDPTLPYERWPVQDFVTCYSYRNRVNTALLPDQIREIPVSG